MMLLRGLGLGDDWSTMAPDETQTGEDRTAASTYCGQKFGVTSPDFQPCVDFYVGPHIGEYTPHATPTAGTTVTSHPATSIPSRWSGAIKTATSNTFLTTGGTPNPFPSTFPGSSPGTPWYKTPIGIGAILAGAFVGFKLLQRKPTPKAA